MKIGTNLIFARLKELRADKNVSQSVVAEKFGVSRQTVDRWENGHREPDVANLWKLADYYEVTVDYLIGREAKSRCLTTNRCCCGEMSAEPVHPEDGYLYDKDIFRLHLQELRAEKGLTQVTLAKELGLAQQTIDRWEHGQREPDIANLWKLAEFYGVTLDYLVGKSCKRF